MKLCIVPAESYCVVVVVGCWYADAWICCVLLSGCCLWSWWFDGSLSLLNWFAWAPDCLVFLPLSGVVCTSSPSIRQRRLMLCRRPMSVALAIGGDREKNGKNAFGKGLFLSGIRTTKMGGKKLLRGHYYTKNHSLKPWFHVWKSVLLERERKSIVYTCQHVCLRIFGCVVHKIFQVTVAFCV